MRRFGAQLQQIQQELDAMKNAISSLPGWLRVLVAWRTDIKPEPRQLTPERSFPQGGGRRGRGPGAMNEHWTHIPGFIKTLTPGVRCTFEQSQALPIFGNYIRKWRNPRQPVLAGQKPWAVSAHSLSDQINHGLLGDSVKGVVLGPDDHSNRGGLVGREGGFSCGWQDVAAISIASRRWAGVRAGAVVVGDLVGVVGG